MWWDNDTSTDYVNFQSVADTVADLLLNNNADPVSIGVSGSWGTGKTSLLNLICRSVANKEQHSPKKLLYVNFNAWLYQGFDDARAALMEAIARKLQDEAEARKTYGDRISELVNNINWIRIARTVTAPATALAAGDPGTALTALGKQVTAEPSENEAAHSQYASTPPQYIQAIRDQFEETLDQLDIKLIVLIDDLDRCLPATTISTLEAMRLFLFLRNTGFVIAADTNMIRHAVAQHFNADAQSALVTSYFDKLVQVPVSVPNLGTHDVRAYMMLLEIQQTIEDPAIFDDIRQRACARLAESWRGLRVDRPFFEEILPDTNGDILNRLDMVDRLAPIMARATDIAGNPRLVKRFMNAISIRMKIAHHHGIAVDEQVVAKMHLFERCAPAGLFDDLQQKVLEHPEGHPDFLKPAEESISKGLEPTLDGQWNDNFVREWIGLPPLLSERDLRGVLYLSRDYSAIVVSQSDLSREAEELLQALIQNPRSARTFTEKAHGLTAPERSKIMERLLSRANEKSSWGAPQILHALLMVADLEPSEGQKLARFLRGRPGQQIRPSIVPKIAGRPWTSDVYEAWLANDQVGDTVKKAINERSQ